MPRATITIFGSNRCESGGEFERACWELGKGLARAGFAVCNGGYGGTMAATAEGARSAGGEVIGVTVGSWGPPNDFVTHSIVRDSLLARLDELVRRGDAYIFLPGATGTLLEIALVLELQSKGMSPPKPLWFLGPQWSPVLRCALADAEPRRWVGGHTRVPDYRFFETVQQIVATAEQHFRC